MAAKQVGLIKFAGMERTVIGDDIQAGQKAPDFLIQKAAYMPTNGAQPAYEEVLSAARAALRN